MVQILEAKPTFSGRLGKGIGEALPDAVNKFSDQMKLKKENEALNERIGLDLSGIQDAETRQKLISDQLTYGRKMKQAQALNKVPLDQQGQGTPSAKQMPQGMGGNNRAEGRNFPQETTTGVSRQIMTPEQIVQEGQRIAAERTNAGVPTSPEDGIAIADANNARNALYNQQIESEAEKRILKQENYGDKAVAKLLKLKPDATDEQQAIFKQKAENVAQNGKSEADIERKLAKEATEFKNDIYNVEKSVPPKRLFSGIKSKLLGTSREAEKERNSLRVAIKPLLDQGLNDTARMILSDKGYYPEEQESVITDLPEGARKTIASMPKIEIMKKETPFLSPQAKALAPKEPRYTHEQENNFHDRFDQILAADPSVNLILLRQAMEDKNVDWELFKDAYDTAVINGFKPSPEQKNQASKLNSPPLNTLDQLLYNMGLIGR